MYILLKEEDSFTYCLFTTITKFDLYFLAQAQSQLQELFLAPRTREFVGSRFLKPEGKTNCFLFLKV